MKAFAAALLGLFITCETVEGARFRWPWEAPRPHRSVPQRQKPDCITINEAINELKPERLELALKRSTKRQRQIIEKCRNERI
jgi:hypothetical protein